LIKRRHLELIGYILVSGPYWESEELSGMDERKKYLYSRAQGGDPYAHARLYILKAISIHFTSFTGSTPRTSSRVVRSTQCTKKEKKENLQQKINPLKNRWV